MLLDVRSHLIATKDVSGYRIPMILTGRGERKLELRIIASFLAAVSRANMTENMV